MYAVIELIRSEERGLEVAYSTIDSKLAADQLFYTRAAQAVYTQEITHTVMLTNEVGIIERREVYGNNKEGAAL